MTTATFDSSEVGAAIAAALDEARRARRALQAGYDVDFTRMTSSIGDLERLFSRHPLAAGAVRGSPLIALLEEIGGLVREIEVAKEEIGTRLAHDRRHRLAGHAYLRAGKA